MSARAERGFTLLEATIATALVAFLVLGISSAVLHSLRTAATLAERAALANDALNILADVREATAYDAGALARIAGRSYATTVVRDGRTLSVAVSVTATTGANAQPVAQVTVTDADGTSDTERRQLAVEAPPPGSVIDEPSPSPAPP